MSSKGQISNSQKLKAAIEKELEWGTSSQWHSKMFDELAEAIFESTGTMLSAATLKRFFGSVNHTGKPSITTLDVLSQFVGSKNWRDFQSKQKPQKTFHAISINWASRSVYMAIGFVIAIVTITIIASSPAQVVINSDEFSFSSQVLSDEYPNSVVFNFDIPEEPELDSIHIQQYWDTNKTIQIQQHQNQATGIYYFPGFFRAKLMVEGQEAKSHDLFLKSNGWLGLIEYEPIPKYFSPVNSSNNLEFPSSIQEEVSHLEKPVISSFHYINDLGNVSGDDFTLSTNIENVFDERWAVCQAMQLYFIGTDGAMIIPFSKIGCSSDNNLMLNDVYLRGKEHDLSQLSADFGEPTELRVEVLNKTVEVSIDGQLVYEGQYNESMGHLVGFRYKFQGLGKVNHFALFDQNHELIDLSTTHKAL